jgi:hypothetical protein
MSAATLAVGPLFFTEERGNAEELAYPSHTVRAVVNNFPLALLSNYNGYEREAYARLFSAAPDLLTALQHALRWNDQLSVEDINRFRAAIYKATGTWPAARPDRVNIAPALAAAKAFGTGELVLDGELKDGMRRISVDALTCAPPSRALSAALQAEAAQVGEALGDQYLEQGDGS